MVVAGVTPNRSPVFLSEPSLVIGKDYLYSYTWQVVDPDGDPVTLDEVQVPPGMTVVGGTHLEWLPTTIQTVAVRLRVGDGQGGTAVQSWTVSVRDNQPPQFHGTPPTSVTAGAIYRAYLDASDADGDVLTYQVLTGPAGLTVNELGIVRWPTTPSQVDAAPVEVRVQVRDGFGGSDEQVWQVTVVGDQQDPQVTVRAHPNPTRVNTIVELSVRASDNVGVAEVTLTVAGQPVQLDARGFGTFLATEAGFDFPIVATARDLSGRIKTATALLTVTDPNLTYPIDISISTPAPGATITAPTNLIGTVDSPGPVQYEVWLEPVGKPNESRKIAEGTTVVINGVLALLDPTILPNGSYLVTLIGRDLSGAPDAVVAIEQQVHVAGNLKLGNFTVSFTDLTIPVSGIPITVTRTYDSLNAANNGELGYGWQLSFDPKLEVEQPDGIGLPYGSYAPFVDGTKVYVTLPNGQRAGYTFQPYPESQLLGLLTYWHPAFVSDPGVTTRLTVPDVLLTKHGNQYVTIEGSGLTTYNPADPIYGGTYTLETVEGLKYKIDARTSVLLSMTDRNDNQLTFGPGGITSNHGVQLVFERDQRGRITAIVDPRGNKFRYGYNAKGDLVSVTDRASMVTARYEYDPMHPHFLTGLTNATGVRALQVTYSNEGRVSVLADAEGHTRNMTYNVTNLTETVTDGQTATTVTLDPRGNVTKVIDDVGHESTTGYGQDDLPEQPDLATTVTQVGQAANGSPLSLTTTLHYDAEGNVDRSTDPTGAATYFTYNRFGQPLTITDQLGNTVTNVYDDQGNLRETTSPVGVVTSYDYFPHGNLKSLVSGGNVSSFSYYATGGLHTSTDANGVLTTFTIDANGNQTGSSWVWTNPDVPSITRALHTTDVFDANDRLFQSTDAQGSKTVILYDAVSRPFRRTDPNGAITETVYDPRGLVIQTISPTGLITQTAYDANGRPSYVTDPYRQGDALIFGTHTTYTPAGQVWKTERVKDLVITLTGAAPRQRADVTFGGTVVSTAETQYDSFGRVERTINMYGLQTQYLYNNVGLQVQVRTESRDEAGTTVWLLQRTVFDSYGRLSIQTDPYLEGTDSGDVLGTRTRYDQLGRVKATDRLKGVQVDLTSDNNTVLVSPATVLSTTQTSYNDEGQVNETIAADGGVTNYEYDDRGRPTASIGPVVLDAATGVQLRHRTETVYNANGQVWKERTNIRQSPDGSIIDASEVRETTHTYDPFGNRVQTTFADSSTLTRTYNTFNEVETETDQVGKTRSFEYQMHQLTAVNLPEIPDPGHNGQLTVPRYLYGYDAFGNYELIRDALGRESNLEYDGQGHLIKRTLPLGQFERFVNDDLGRGKLHISFEGVVTASSYDDLGRLSKKEYFSSEAAYNNGAGTPSQTEQYVYDAFSRLVRQTTTVQGVSTPSVTTWMYDLEGRITQIASPEGTINYEYDDLGQKRRMYTGSPSDPVDDTRYSYDALGRLETVTVWARNGQALPESSREVTRYGYDLVGNLVRVDQPNGIISRYEYDTVNRLLKLTHYLPDATPSNLSDNAKLAEFAYQPRPDGKWEGATETEWLDGTPHVINVTWTYDAVGRLTDEVFNHYDDSLDYTAHYDMDLVGNRLAKTVDHGSNGSIDDYFAYGYDSNDRLLTETQDLASGAHLDITYSYGGTGNSATYLTGKTTKDASTHAVLETVDYTYNLAGKMSQVDTETYVAGNVVARETATFSYCECGLRTQATNKVEQDADNDPGTPLTVESETATVYLNDLHNATGYSQVIRETVQDVPTGQVTKQVVTTVGLDVISQKAFTPDEPGGAETRVLLYDGHGSTRLLTNAAAVLLQIYAYDAYGIAVGFDPSAALTTLLYSGEQTDIPTSLQNLRARWYDPSKGRFNGLDPFFGELRDPQDFNKYLYAHSDPVNGLDPSGQDTTISANISLGLRAAFNGIQTVTIDAAHRWGYTVAYRASTSAIATIGSMGLLGLIGITTIAGAIAALFPPVPAPGPTPTSGPQTFAEEAQQAIKQFEEFKKDPKKCKCPTQIHYAPLDSRDRARAVLAILDKKTVGGAYSPFKIDPHWWKGLPFLGFEWEKGHLLGSQLGGTGMKKLENLVPVSHPANLLMLDELENPVRNAAEKQCVLLLVLAPHIGDEYYPSRIYAKAEGDKGFNLAVRLPNP